MFLMGCDRRFLHIAIYTILSLTMVHGSTTYNSSALDGSIRSFAAKALVGKHTGTFVNVSLPANFSNIEASVIRLRSRSFWERGVNFSSFYIPPRVLPFPFVKRLAIVCLNLGNLSDYYYKVPGHSLLAPVVGFMGYDNTNLSVLGNLTRLHVFDDPIAVRFSNINQKDGNSSELKCVKFGENGLIEFSNLTEDNMCMTLSDGHFSVAVPSPPEMVEKKRPMPWLIVVVICAGVILVLIILVNCYKIVRSKKISKMENESDKGLAFDMTWIGGSKLPSASMVRTQPALEHDDLP